MAAPLRPMLLASLSLLLLGSGSQAKEPAKPAEDTRAVTVRAGHDFVDVKAHIPTVLVELPYATENNFFKKRFYKSNRCLLRRSVAERLAKVQAELSAQGLGIKVWDGYRPRSVQYEFWKVLPDPRYVGDPKQGSRHNRGAAVDLTFVDLATGKELEMPTGYDDFSPKAAADFKLASPTAMKNRTVLQQVMTRHGFEIFPSEWWHFDASGWREFPLENFSPEDHPATPAPSQK